MPRGVYDRSKTKTQRAAEKSHAAPAAVSSNQNTKKAAGAKRGPKPGFKRKAQNQASSTETFTKNASANMETATHPFHSFHEIRSNLETLRSLSEQFRDLPMIRQEVEANVGILGMLRDQYFPQRTSEQQETAQQQPAQATSNGVTASIPLPPTVPNIIPPTAS